MAGPGSGKFIATLKTRAEAHGGRAFEQVVLGRPVYFVDDDPAADRVAEDTLGNIARTVGFKELSFQYEPIAAALHYETAIAREELVLVADIGGGTSDFSIVRLSPERLDRLLALIRERAGHWLAHQVEQAKIALSGQDTVLAHCRTR